MASTTAPTKPELSLPTVEEAKAEVSRNFELFKKMSFEPEDSGRHVLLHGGEVIEIMDTLVDAYKLGAKLYGHPGRFSVQTIDEKPLDLSHWNHPRRRVRG